ncbi:muskelin isoform X2 [Bombyx mori]|uniref:muskelin isoform X2 n=1 Tax=Bombyx mori TaxID=7091 RepID=UPI002ED1FEC2
MVRGKKDLWKRTVDDRSGSRNIIVNQPSDPLSRWFTDCCVSPQFIVIKLDSPSIVETIKFGKYIKALVSDLKKFQVYGGTEDSNMSLLLTAGLKKDSTPETFRLRHRTQEGFYFPVEYLKIVPLQSWGPPYNYTIWYIELHGKNQAELLNEALETIYLRKEEEAVRLLLKHLRRRRYKDAFEALSRESGVQLEGPTQTKLWNALVENGDYQAAEKIFEQAVNDGELEWYMSWQPYRPEWREMSACSAQVEERLRSGDAHVAGPPAAPHDLLCADREPRPDAAGAAPVSNELFETCDLACGLTACCNKPGPRGGHQLVVDSTTGTLYLFGGWNGTEDLDDLWSYSTKGERWTLLCRHSSLVGGPTPRSCHKMVFDPVHRRLYTLGRYLDNAQRVPSNMNSDLYMYDVWTGEWYLVCSDTASAGGPRLVFDHQMCIDADTQTIYVFGGRVLPANTEEVVSPQYSGLYAYYISTGTWQLLLADKHDEDAPQPRVSHSMLFHPVQRRLYIFAGQRNKEHLLDLWWYEVGSGACGALCRCGAAPPPAAGFTQRATLDPDTDQMFVLSGMSKEKEKRVYNTLWVLSLRTRTWSCLYRAHAPPAPAPAPGGPAPTSRAPTPRFAHQLVYDPNTKIHYLFGGNPGIQSSPRLRLDDLWSLRLVQPSLEQVWGEARAILREACYREMATQPGATVQALSYLRNELSSVMDHTDPAQVSRFQKLATLLFSGGDEGAALPSPRALSPRRTRALLRARTHHASHAHIADALAQVLGAEEPQPELTLPFEEAGEPQPETWEVGVDEDMTPDTQWHARQPRLALYDTLAQYFRPSTVPPRGDVTDLVAL